MCCYGDVSKQSSNDGKSFNVDLDVKIREQFFDLTVDADERNNRISELAYQETIQELRQRMEDFFEKYSNEVNSGILYPVTGSGQMKRCHEDEAFDQRFSYYYK